MCAPRVNLLALWYLGFSVQAHIKCTEACPKNQVLWEHLCSADAPLLLSVTGHTWAVCVAQAPRSCLVLKFPDCTQHMHWFMLRNPWSCSERQSLCCISYNLCILNNLHWKWWRRKNVLHPSIWNTWLSFVPNVKCCMLSQKHEGFNLLEWKCRQCKGKDWFWPGINCIGGLNVLYIEHLRAASPGGCLCCSSLSIAAKWRVLNKTLAWVYACCISWYVLTSFWLSGSSNSGI